ncbi:MAG TPA: methyl-accepting chemotaxis protein [Ideonella sp.]|nr:methyl-accepting chemotaxis protein [Ideonella sp.]
MINMKISAKLTMAFAILATLIALLGAAALFKVTAINGQLNLALDDRYPKIKRFQRIKDGNSTVARAMRDLFIETDPAQIKASYDEMARVSKEIGELYTELESSMSTPKGKAGFQKLSAARAEYKVPREKVMAQLKAGQMEEAKATLINELRPKQIVYIAVVDEMIALGDSLMEAASDQADAEVAATQWTVAALIGLALAAACGLGWWVVRSTTRPIRNAVDVAKAVAAGDLTMEFDASGNTETGELLRALKEMQLKLADIVGKVRQNADGVATASAQIASGNNDLSARTENQASALQQTAASMEELGSTVRSNSDSAQQANQLAIGASDVAARGGSAVRQVVETMKGIRESSSKIADIIGTIDGIAFQTNILALNAAVEAARAGEQGRGFAVVASEVRSLAHRSAEAAKQIKGLITQSVERVEQGTLQVDEAGATINDVVTSIQRVTDIMAEISSASREQSSGVVQVGEAVTAMDQATQQNAALVEQSAAAAESLRTQAQVLVELVSVFKLAGGNAVVHARALPASAIAASAIGKAAAKASAKPAAAPAAVAKDKPRSAPRPPVAASQPTAAPTPGTASGGQDDWTSF